MLWEGNPLESVKAGLLKLDVESLLFEPCANYPSNGDFMSIMKKNIKALEGFL